MIVSAKESLKGTEGLRIIGRAGCQRELAVEGGTIGSGGGSRIRGWGRGHRSGSTGPGWGAFWLEPFAELDQNGRIDVEGSAELTIRIQIGTLTATQRGEIFSIRP